MAVWLCSLALIKLMVTVVFIFLCQRIWRRYHVIRTISEQLHEDWELLMNQPNIDLTTQWISRKMLRPFLFFIIQPSSWYNGQWSRTVESILTCFKIILNSINSMGMWFLVILLMFWPFCFLWSTWVFAVQFFLGLQSSYCSTLYKMA